MSSFFAALGFLRFDSSCLRSGSQHVTFERFASRDQNYYDFSFSHFQGIFGITTINILRVTPGISFLFPEQTS